MPLVYEQACEAIHDMAKEILVAHHPELEMAPGEYPTLCIMFVSQKDPDEIDAPLKINGDPCAAIISVIPHKQRADERADAEILIDAKVWAKLAEQQRRALLDHECTHMELKVDQDGILQVDGCGRPKIGMRRHDWVLTGFLSISKRYGGDALEVIDMRRFMKDYGDSVLPKEALFQ